MNWPSQLSVKLRKLPQWLAWRGIPLTPSGMQMAFNGRRLAGLRDRHRGRRCFVIGNGPSLTVADLERLRGEVTIAANKIYLAFPQTNWRPSYLVVIDEVTAANNRRELRAQHLPKLYSWEAAALLLPDPRAVVVRTLAHPRQPDGSPGIGFSDDLLRGAHGGYSVTYFSLQTAAWMGMTEVYLIGVDFFFHLAPSTGKTTTASGEILVSQGEQNHFLPGYRHPGETWTYPDLDRQREAFAVARQWFEARGGRLINASRQTHLDVLERVDLDEVLGKGKSF